MAPHEYTKKIDDLEQELQKKKSALAKEYAFSNSTVVVGDIVTDHIGSVVVDEIKYTTGNVDYLPCCVYYGFELKKDMTRRKDNSRRAVFQSNIQS